jgi:hypothetical protein
LVDGLLQQLKSSKQGDRFEAILAIKKIGPGAEAAIPALTEVASNDPEGALRELAKSCLDVIRQPQPIQSERIVVDFLKPIEVHLDVPITEEIRKARKVVGGDLYSVVTIHNKTKGPINYLYRWGNGNWNQAKLNPDNGMSYSHKYKFVNEHKSPSFEVQFDRNVSPTATWIVYKLERNPSPSRNPDFGRRYDFEQSNYNHIVLKERE